MSEREQWEQARKRLHIAGLREREPELRRVEQAKPPMEKLTGTEEWDLFLQVLQAALDKHVAERDGWAQVHATEANFSYDRLVEVKTQLKLADDRVRLLDWVMGLPKSLIEEANKAHDARRTIDTEA